ncbi:MAG: ATP-dependent RNA helicase HrpA, partial [Pseudomonadota bacterium]
IDEAHERSLNIDFLLGILRTLLPKRPDLKVIITSATIDHARFAAFFGDAPVIEVSGRGYPVTIEYTEDDIPADDSRRLARAVCDAVAALQARTLPSAARDLLVFLPGEREIRDAERALLKSGLAPEATWEILPLFGRLADGRQQAIFKKSGKRRIVLATNVAETSLTVPRIGAVVDSGLARLKRYSTRSRIERLQIERIARASANQRAGRCGRVGPGICIRLYGEAEFGGRAAFTDAEILRSNLASVVLQLEALGLPPPESFPLLDRPDPARVEDARRLLVELGALDSSQRMTKLGRRLSRLPLDPRLGRMLLAPIPETLAPALITVVAGLSIQEPRQRPMEQASAADEAHAQWAHPGSDFLTLLNLWHSAEAARAELGRSAYERWCEAQFVSVRRLREWREVAQQLGRLLKLKVSSVTLPDGKEEEGLLHAALLTGLVTQVGVREEDNLYAGTGRTRFGLHPSSALQAKPPRWVMALEIVETRRRLARYAATVEPAAVQSAAVHLLEYDYGKPYWSSRRGRVEAQRTTLLRGLVLEADRRVNFAPVDRASARAVFLRQALAGDRLRLQASFLSHNRALREAISALAGKARRLVEVSESGIAAWYGERLPEHVVDAASLKRWLKKNDDGPLHLTETELLAETPSIDTSAVPNATTLAGNKIQIEYAFAPDRADDGATLRVPERLLRAVTASDIDLSVPGWLAERIALRLRALPKAQRKQLHPIAERAAALVDQLRRQRSNETLDDRLRRALLREFNVEVAAGTWDHFAEPDHLRPRIVVIDEKGQSIAAGRELDALVAGAPEPAATMTESAVVMASAPARQWQFATLPEPRVRQDGDLTLKVYPALQQQGGGVVVHDFLDAVQAAAAHSEAVVALLRFRFAQQLKALRKALIQDRAVQLLWSAFADQGGEVLLDDYQDAVVRVGVPVALEGIRDAESFATLCQRYASAIVPSGETLRATHKEVLEEHAAVRARLAQMPAAYGEAVDDVRAQIAALVYPGFLAATPPDRVADLARYLRGALQRLERLASNPSRDTESMAMVASLAARQAALGSSAAGPNQAAAVGEFRWLVEELRISLFAQTLGTRGKVSLRRLEKRWDDVLRLPD